jgi:hypothetical protein
MLNMLARNLRSAAFVAAPAITILNVHASPTLCVGKHDAVSHAKEERERRIQYTAAMAWCAEDSKNTAYLAAKADEDGNKKWPLISRRGLMDRILGKVNNSMPYEKNSVLTHDEELAIKEACKELNRHGQGIDRAQLGRMVIDSLELRPIVNRGRKYTPLSANAKKMLETGTVGQGWYTAFFAEHTDIKEKQPCSEEIARAKWMTKSNSLLHFERLGATMNSIPGFIVNGKVADPRRWLNSDECQCYRVRDVATPPFALVPS